MAILLRNTSINNYSFDGIQLPSNSDLDITGWDVSGLQSDQTFKSLINDPNSGLSVVDTTATSGAAVANELTTGVQAIQVLSAEPTVRSWNGQSGDVTFTETVYVHPGTHSADIITESATKKWVSQPEKDSWNQKIDQTLIGTASGVASLDAVGKIPSNQLPAISITNVFVVPDVPSRDALTVQTGDVAKITTTSESFIYDGTTWMLLNSTDTVTSVNGQIGDVVISVPTSTTDVPEGTNLYYTDVRVNDNVDPKLATKSDINHTHTPITGLGDISNGNWTEFEPDGTLVMHGEATVWNVISISPTSLFNNTETSPSFGKYQDNGFDYVDAGLHFDYKSKQNGVIPAHNALSFHHHSFSVGFWIEPHRSSCYVISKEDEIWAIEISGKKIRVDLKDNGKVKSSQQLTWQKRNCVVVTFIDTGLGTNINIYQNNVLVESNVLSSRIYDLQNKPVYIGCEGKEELGNKKYEKHFDGILDEIRFWNKPLTPDEVNQFWNNGNGTEIEIAPLETVASYRLNENIGLIAANSTSISGIDMALNPGPNNTPTWGSGLLIGTTQHQNGVFTYWFEEELDQDLYFSIEMQHDYMEGTDITPHIQWSPIDNNSGIVVWGIEYTWANIGDTSPLTSVDETLALTENLALKHQETHFPPILGTGKQINSILIGRLYRKGTDTNDTYPKKAGILSLGFHYKQDTLGSRTMDNK